MPAFFVAVALAAATFVPSQAAVGAIGLAVFAAPLIVGGVVPVLAPFFPGSIFDWAVADLDRRAGVARDARSRGSSAWPFCSLVAPAAAERDGPLAVTSRSSNASGPNRSRHDDLCPDHSHPQAGRRASSRRSRSALIASAAVFGLLISGVVFLAMAVAFEIAVPIAQQYDVSISAGDMAVAARVAELWWIPGGIAIASFLAAAGVALKAIDRVGSDPRG